MSWDQSWLQFRAASGLGLPRHEAGVSFAKDPNYFWVYVKETWQVMCQIRNCPLTRKPLRNEAW